LYALLGDLQVYFNPSRVENVSFETEPNDNLSIVLAMWNIAILFQTIFVYNLGSIAESWYSNDPVPCTSILLWHTIPLALYTFMLSVVAHKNWRYHFSVCLFIEFFVYLLYKGAILCVLLAVLTSSFAGMEWMIAWKLDGKLVVPWSLVSSSICSGDSIGDSTMLLLLS
jgi:hypothetical protein